MNLATVLPLLLATLFVSGQATVTIVQNGGDCQGVYHDCEVVDTSALVASTGCAMNSCYGCADGNAFLDETCGLDYVRCPSPDKSPEEGSANEMEYSEGLLYKTVQCTGSKVICVVQADQNDPVVVKSGACADSLENVLAMPTIDYTNLGTVILKGGAQGACVYPRDYTAEVNSLYVGMAGGTPPHRARLSNFNACIKDGVSEGCDCKYIPSATPPSHTVASCGDYTLSTSYVSACGKINWRSIVVLDPDSIQVEIIDSKVTMGRCGTWAVQYTDCKGSVQTVNVAVTDTVPPVNPPADQTVCPSADIALPTFTSACLGTLPVEHLEVTVEYCDADNNRDAPVVTLNQGKISFAACGCYQVTVTPMDCSDALVTASAVTFRVTVTETITAASFDAPTRKALGEVGICKTDSITFTPFVGSCRGALTSKVTYEVCDKDGCTAPTDIPVKHGTIQLPAYSAAGQQYKLSATAEACDGTTLDPVTTTVEVTDTLPVFTRDCDVKKYHTECLGDVTENVEVEQTWSPNDDNPCELKLKMTGSNQCDVSSEVTETITLCNWSKHSHMHASKGGSCADA